MPSDVNVCREYQHEACCSLETVRKCVFFYYFFFPNFFSFEGEERERDETEETLSLSFFESLFASLFFTPSSIDFC